PVWVEDQKAQLGDDGWRQEVERNFLSSGETYIDPKLLKALQDRTKDIHTVRRLFREWTNKDDKLEKNDGWGDIGAFW
ncbi:hypothetical protein, partial [Enterococcus casseliflavus]|uniref:hypothetical protein n=1 Tax=Enterococcus casseliflavus TaxID=37734 RepID=UPI003D13DE7D